MSESDVAGAATRQRRQEVRARIAQLEDELLELGAPVPSWGSRPEHVDEGRWQALSRFEARVEQLTTALSRARAASRASGGPWDADGQDHWQQEALRLTNEVQRLQDELLELRSEVDLRDAKISQLQTAVTALSGQSAPAPSMHRFGVQGRRPSTGRGPLAPSPTPRQPTMAGLESRASTQGASQRDWGQTSALRQAFADLGPRVLVTFDELRAAAERLHGSAVPAANLRMYLKREKDNGRIDCDGPNIWWARDQSQPQWRPTTDLVQQAQWRSQQARQHAWS